jgi:hypothetical protein
VEAIIGRWDQEDWASSPFSGLRKQGDLPPTLILFLFKGFEIRTTRSDLVKKQTAHEKQKLCGSSHPKVVRMGS